MRSPFAVASYKTPFQMMQTSITTEMLFPIIILQLLLACATSAFPYPAQAQYPANHDATTGVQLITPQLNESRDPIVTCFPRVQTAILEVDICREMLERTILRFPMYSQNQPFVAHSRPQVYPDKPHSVPPFAFKGATRDGLVRCSISITPSESSKPDVFSWARVMRVANKILEQCTGTGTTDGGGVGDIGNRDRWRVEIRPWQNRYLSAGNNSVLSTVFATMDNDTIASAIPLDVA